MRRSSAYCSERENIRGCGFTLVRVLFVDNRGKKGSIEAGLYRGKLGVIRRFYVLYYFDHSRDPSFHSWMRPTRRISRKVRVLVDRRAGWLRMEAAGQGRRRAISMSNTRKMTARIKKRIENGRRALFLGSNPHSNGEDFSRV